MIATGETVGLVEWIIDDPSLVFLMAHPSLHLPFLSTFQKIAFAKIPALYLRTQNASEIFV